MSAEAHAVTGAFGYSGRHIATRLLGEGRRVLTLTNKPPEASPFGERVRACPLDFRRPDRLEESLRGVSVLYNTYWVRFNHRTFSHARAVENSLVLFEAARRAGVRRIVHVSITNPSEESGLEYFSGKARLERALRESGVPHSVLRPAVLFGGEDILINNIAWILRRLPVFGLFGDGRYRLRPIHVDDLAGLAAEHGALEGDAVVDAVGPETYTYRDLVRTIGRVLGKRRLLVPVPPAAGHLFAVVLGKMLGDVVITRDEIRGLMAGLLWVDSPPAGSTRFSSWAAENRGRLGRRYASELARRSG